MKKIWILGGEGHIGSALTELLDIKEYEILSTDIEEVDITKNDEVYLYAERYRPDVIINASGITDLKECRENIEKAFKVNAIGVRNLSVCANKIGAKIIQISTDDVFDGTSIVPYNEFDDTNPRSIYGKSKLAGEKFLRDMAGKYIIIRSSWVYGTGKDFVNYILNYPDSNSGIEISSEEIASPTSAKEIAKVILRLMRKMQYGIYHIACKGSCNRVEFANEILRLSNKKLKIISVDKIENRPTYSVLDNLMLRISDMEEPLTWKEALKEYIKEVNTNNEEKNRIDY